MTSRPPATSAEPVVSAILPIRFRMPAYGGTNPPCCPSNLFVELQFPSPHPQRPQPQSVQPDEAFGILLIVGALVILEGDQGRGIERLFALAAGHQDVALVELEP